MTCTLTDEGAVELQVVGPAVFGFEEEPAMPTSASSSLVAEEAVATFQVQASFVTRVLAACAAVPRKAAEKAAATSQVTVQRWSRWRALVVAGEQGVADTRMGVTVAILRQAPLSPPGRPLADRESPAPWPHQPRRNRALYGRTYPLTTADVTVTRSSDMTSSRNTLPTFGGMEAPKRRRLAAPQPSW